jgi:hypothetical protein
MIARPLVHEVMPAFIPPWRIFVIQPYNPFRDRRECGALLARSRPIASSPRF